MTKRMKKVAELEEIQEMIDDRQNRFFETARRVVLATVGAVALAQDELEEFVNRLVERGEIAEKDARKLLREVTEKRTRRAEHELDRRVEDLLDRLNVPSKGDIDSLSHKITTLTHKIDEVKTRKTKVSAN